MPPTSARIIAEHKTRYIIASNGVEYSAVVRGVFHRAEAEHAKVFPKVGDYVEFTETAKGEAVIETVLPRRTEIARTSQARDKREGGVTVEVLVANVDVAFIVMGLDKDFNVSRAERYMSLVASSKVKPVLILNKCDAVDDPDAYVAQVKERLPQAQIHAVSAKTGENMEVMLGYLGDDVTAVLLGSSGAGKSTISNWLLQANRQATGGVREDDSRGRHTTTSRELFAIPTGGSLIDTPGMRELGHLGEADGVFTEIEALTTQCRFTDCDHEKSDGCAIRAAIAQGDISESQFENYLKLRRERAYAESKNDEESARRFKEDKKKLHKSYLPIQRRKYFERE